MRRRRAGEKAGIAGFVLATIGVGAVVSSMIGGGQPDGHGQLAVIAAAGQATIIGVMLMCYSGLVRRTGSSRQVALENYDRGYERGFQEGAAERPPRPVVVDLESRRCRCGTEKALTSVGSAVDRV